MTTTLTTRQKTEVFLAVQTHPVTGGYSGRIKIDPAADGMPTGGATLEDITANALSLVSAWLGLPNDMITLTVIAGEQRQLSAA